MPSLTLADRNQLVNSPVALTWTSAIVIAPTISQLILDTGALAAGDYDFVINLLVLDDTTLGKGMWVEHRNAANSASVQTIGGCGPAQASQLKLDKYTLATNERIRVITGVVAGGATNSRYIASIGRRLSSL